MVITVVMSLDWVLLVVCLNLIVYVNSVVLYVSVCCVTRLGLLLCYWLLLVMLDLMVAILVVLGFN